MNKRRVDRYFEMMEKKDKKSYDTALNIINSLLEASPECKKFQLLKIDVF